MYIYKLTEGGIKEVGTSSGTYRKSDSEKKPSHP